MAANAEQMEGITVPPSDQRYDDLVRSWNGRFIGKPDYIRVVDTTGQVEHAVAEAVHSGKRLAVRSGGHCLEGFVTDPNVRVQVDMSQMSAIYFDSERQAIAVEPGASLREVYKTMFTEWSVTVPGGVCPAVGAGGHFCGGGFGALTRRSGIVPDHIYGVEVVTVDNSGTPRTVVATCEPDDPNRELWFAHAGGGGGNFGVITRYWMRTPGTSGSDPSRLLPRPPKQIRYIRYSWPWNKLNKSSFMEIVRNHIAWHVENSAPDSPYSRLYADLTCPHIDSSPTVFIEVQIDPTEADSSQLLDGFRSAVIDSAPVLATTEENTYPWLQSTNVLGYADTGGNVGRRNKGKGSYLRECYTEDQLATTYHYLAETDLPNAPLAGILFFAYGGQVNALASDANAVPQRDSVIKALHTVHWTDAAEDDHKLSWLREFYRDVHASTGGVPALDCITDGSYINYADIDLADPRWNTSGIPWYRFYYKNNYERLQEAKAKWDPCNVFHHDLSIELPR